MIRWIVGLASLALVLTLFTYSADAVDVETLYLDVTTQEQAEVEDLVDSGAYKDLDLSLNSRVMVNDYLGVEGSVTAPLSDLDQDNLSYTASVLGRLAYKGFGIEPHIDYVDDSIEDSWFAGVRVGKINRR